MELNKKHRKEDDARIIRLKLGKVRREAHIAELMDQLESANELQEDQMK